MFSTPKKQANSQFFLPDEKVVSALCESYMNIRKGRWNLKEDEPIEQVTATGKEKIDSCIELLQIFKAAKTFDDWVQVVYSCTKRHDAEDKVQPKNRWFGFVLQHVLDDPLLLYTVDATLAYIISTLMRNEQFTKLIVDLTTEKAKHDKLITEAIAHKAAIASYQKEIDASNDLKHKLDIFASLVTYHENYFVTVTLAREPLATKLNEKSFADFENSVKTNKRELKLCEKILSYAKNPENKKDKKNAPVVESKEVAKSEVKPIKPVLSEEKATAPIESTEASESSAKKDSPLLANSLLSAPNLSARRKNGRSRREEVEEVIERRYGLRNGRG